MVRSDIKDFINTIPKEVTVVAASKYVDDNDIKVLLESGIDNIGENRVESFLEKYEKLKEYPIKWHFIGHLQRNKLNKVIDKIDFLESLDSLELAKMINIRRTAPLKCFVEISINLEENKNGVPYFAAKNFIEALLEYKNIEVVGLMMMTIKNSENDSLDEQFSKLRELRDELEKELKIKLPYLSMGMSEDYQVAIKNGATHIRLGRILFNML